MKCSEASKALKKDGWKVISQKGSHLKLKHDEKDGIIILPNHGSKEIRKGLQKKLIKDDGIK